MKEDVILEIRDEFLMFFRGEKSIYNIHLNQLAETLDDNETAISTWVNQISEKDWATREILYELASIIKEKHPDNEINWEATFYIVEKEDYNDKAYAMKQSLETGQSEKPDSDLVDFIEQFKFGTSDKSKETQEAISKIVKDQLRKYKIID